jgi:type II secretory pathway component PulJ
MLMKIFSKTKREGGFTMIELLASMFILTTGVLVAWSAIMTSTVKSAGRAQQLAGLQTEVRFAVNALAADLRQAQCKDTITNPVSTSTATQVTFWSADRLTPYHLRQVSYRLSSGQLQRQIATSTNTGGPPWTMGATGGWSTLVSGITNASIFTYKTAANVATTTASQVASANINLVIAPPAGLGGSRATYQTNVALRSDTCF